MSAAPTPLPLAVLISGRGSNMASIARACQSGEIDARIVRVLADRADAAGIALAESLGHPVQVVAAAQFQDRLGFEAALADAIDAAGARLVVLAGFMRILSPPFVQRYTGRMLNIHPSLLPKYKGMHTHRRVLEAGEHEHGVSVHFVTEALDGGPVIYRARVPVLPSDTEQSLASRVLLEEHRIYPKVIGLIAARRLALAGANVLFDGQLLASPLEDEPHAPGALTAIG
jgi:phosphoribosylglycinamide formyltransferase 1